MSGLGVELVGADDGRWDDIVGRTRHDVFHTAGFQRFAAAAEGGEAWLAVVGDEARGMAWPHVLRHVSRIEGLEDSPARDIGAFHGYGGPLAWGARPDDPWLTAAGATLRDAWRSLGVVSVFVRLHPLVGCGEVIRAFDPPASSGVRVIGPAISIDCRLDDEAARAGYARVTRQEIARARRAGFVTEVDGGWRGLDAFVRLYEATMERNDAASEYRLSCSDVERLREALGDRLALLVTTRGGHVAAAGLFTSCDGIAQALAVGTDPADQRLSPLKLLLDDARRWAHDRGDGLLFLGGGRGGRTDGLFEFKRRFSDLRHHVHAGAWVLDAPTYRQLTKLRSAWLARHGQRVAASHWFPAYRAPVESLPRATGRPQPVPRPLASIPIQAARDVVAIDVGGSAGSSRSQVPNDHLVVRKVGPAS